jgi:hypothetical protein
MKNTYGRDENPFAKKEDKNTLSPESFLPQVNITVSKLPSKSLPYPNLTLKYRPYTFGEVKRVNQGRMDEKESIEFVLSGVETNIDKNDLTLADTLYIGLLRKISTIGSTKVVVPINCRRCNTPIRKLVDIDKLEFEDLKAPMLPVIGDFNMGEIAFKPVTVGQYFKLINMGKHDDDIALMSIQSNLDFDKAYKYFYNCSIEDGRTLDNVDEFLFHGLKPIDIHCNNDKCNHVNKVELDGGEALLIPFRESEESAPSKIHFGTKAKH